MQESAFGPRVCPHSAPRCVGPPLECFVPHSPLAVPFHAPSRLRSALHSLNTQLAALETEALLEACSSCHHARPSLGSLSRLLRIAELAAAQPIVDAFAASDDQLRLLAHSLAEALNPSSAAQLLQSSLREASGRWVALFSCIGETFRSIAILLCQRSRSERLPCVSSSSLHLIGRRPLLPGPPAPPRGPTPPLWAPFPASSRLSAAPSRARSGSSAPCPPLEGSRARRRSSARPPRS